MMTVGLAGGFVSKTMAFRVLVEQIVGHSFLYFRGPSSQNLLDKRLAEPVQ